MTNNSCIETVTSKRVVKGSIKGKEQGGFCRVNPYRNGGVKLCIEDQTFSKSDFKHLIDSLSEIHEVL